MLFRVLVTMAIVVMPDVAAMAAETVSYTYDAQGRLIRVVKSGSVNNGAAVQYTYDAAGNRVRVTATGSPNG
jgi:uncharacterized protein RhaS with RHS repeats